MNWNWLDFVIALMLLVSTVTAARKGFSREVIGLAATVLAVILGTWFYGTAGGYFEPYVSSRNVASFLGFGVVFVGVLLVGALVAAIIHRFLKTVGLNWIDRIMGAAFGIARGLLACVALVMILTAFAPGTTDGTPPRSVVDSRLAPYVLGTCKVLTAMAPHELKEEFGNRYEQIRRKWQASPAPPVHGG